MRTVALESNEQKSKIGKYVAIDCEMVGVGPEGIESALAQVVIVNYHGAVLLNTYVRPKERVTDYRTDITGITSKQLHPSKAQPFEEVQRKVAELIKGRVVIGHGLKNDFKALLLEHPRCLVRDTSLYKPFRKQFAKGRTPALRKLSKGLLNQEIQGAAHSPVEDARAALTLYKEHRELWEKSVTRKFQVKARKLGKPGA